MRSCRPRQRIRSQSLLAKLLEAFQSLESQVTDLNILLLYLNLSKTTLGCEINYAQLSKEVELFATENKIQFIKRSAGDNQLERQETRMKLLEKPTSKKYLGKKILTSLQDMLRLENREAIMKAFCSFAGEGETMTLTSFIKIAKLLDIQLSDDDARIVFLFLDKDGFGKITSRRL